MKNLKDQVVVITGASRGIGAAMAEAFARQKCKLVLCGRDRHMLDQIVERVALPKEQVITVTSDIRTGEGMKAIVDAAFDKFGRVDLFINNAGVGFIGPVTDTTEEQFDDTFATNLKSVFLSFKELLPRLKAQGGGRIINVSSMAGNQGLPGMAVYAASKAALNSLSDGFAGEVRGDNIMVSILAPGSTETTFGGRGPASKKGKRRMKPEDVAAAAVHMAQQDDNAWVSKVEMRPLITKD